MWNETDIPLAYLITFRSYGTWLHGDERGSVDRFHNRYQSPLIAPNPAWKNYNSRNLKMAAVIFNALQRKTIEESVRETCRIRGWILHAVNVRTNHVHSVVSVGAGKPERALNALKANATWQMREKACWNSEKSPWADKGSKRYLWNERSVSTAIDYVLNGQGDKLPNFD